MTTAIAPSSPLVMMATTTPATSTNKLLGTITPSKTAVPVLSKATTISSIPVRAIQVPNTNKLILAGPYIVMRTPTVAEQVQALRQQQEKNLAASTTTSSSPSSASSTNIAGSAATTATTTAIAVKKETPTPELLRVKRRADLGKLGFPEVKPVSVSRRNARERNRVKLVNQGFEVLREHVPNGKKNRKMSKVDTLKSAVDYIRQMQELIREHDEKMDQSPSPLSSPCLSSSDEVDGVTIVAPSSFANVNSASECSSSDGSSEGGRGSANAVSVLRSVCNDNGVSLCGDALTATAMMETTELDNAILASSSSSAAAVATSSSSSSLLSSSEDIVIDNMNNNNNNNNKFVNFNMNNNNNNEVNTAQLMDCTNNMEVNSEQNVNIVNNLTQHVNRVQQLNAIQPVNNVQLNTIQALASIQQQQTSASNNLQQQQISTSAFINALLTPTSSSTSAATTTSPNGNNKDATPPQQVPTITFITLPIQPALTSHSPVSTSSPSSDDVFLSDVQQRVLSSSSSSSTGAGTLGTVTSGAKATLTTLRGVGSLSGQRLSLNQACRRHLSFSSEPDTADSPSQPQVSQPQVLQRVSSSSLSETALMSAEHHNQQQQQQQPQQISFTLLTGQNATQLTGFLSGNASQTLTLLPQQIPLEQQQQPTQLLSPLSPLHQRLQQQQQTQPQSEQQQPQFTPLTNLCLPDQSTNGLLSSLDQSVVATTNEVSLVDALNANFNTNATSNNNSNNFIRQRQFSGGPHHQTLIAPGNVAMMQPQLQVDQVPSPSLSTSSSHTSESSYESYESLGSLEEDLQDISNWITELCSSGQDIHCDADDGSTDFLTYGDKQL